MALDDFSGLPNRAHFAEVCGIPGGTNECFGFISGASVGAEESFDCCKLFWIDFDRDDSL